MNSEGNTNTMSARVGASTPTPNQSPKRIKSPRDGSARALFMRMLAITSPGRTWAHQIPRGMAKTEPMMSTTSVNTMCCSLRIMNPESPPQRCGSIRIDRASAIIEAAFPPRGSVALWQAGGWRHRVKP